MALSNLWFDPSLVFLDGAWVAGHTKSYLPIEDPSRGAIIGEIAQGSVADVDAAVDAASRALTSDWGKSTAAERGRVLQKWASP